nr:MAG TPA: hypothetical protein [Caudoviricetes sp.]
MYICFFLYSVFHVYMDTPLIFYEFIGLCVCAKVYIHIGGYSEIGVDFENAAQNIVMKVNKHEIAFKHNNILIENIRTT